MERAAADNGREGVREASLVRALGIPRIQARAALERLEDSNLLELTHAEDDDSATGWLTRKGRKYIVEQGIG